MCFSASLDEKLTGPTISAALKKFLCVIDGFFMRVCPLLQCIESCLTRLRTSSWEFISTLGYELDIIRGHLRFRWSIWVGSNSPLFLFCSIVVVRKNLICPPGSFTPLPVWPPSQWSSLIFFISMPRPRTTVGYVPYCPRILRPAL